MTVELRNIAKKKKKSVTNQLLWRNVLEVATMR